MAIVQRTTSTSAGHVEGHETPPQSAVGASFPFDPGRDGLASIYATRLLDRGVDPRALCAEVRADRLGTPERGALSRALMQRSRVVRFGRGTAPHLTAVSASLERAEREPVPVKPPRKRPSFSLFPSDRRLARRLATAGLALVLGFASTPYFATAQESVPLTRYIVQPGETIDIIASTFGLDPATLEAANGLEGAAFLTPQDVLVIPPVSIGGDDASWLAFQAEESSPFVVGAHYVTDGETLADIAYAYNIDPWALAGFNGVSDIDSLTVGQRLLVPLTDAVTSPGDDYASERVAEDQSIAAWQSTTEWDGVGGVDSGWVEPEYAPVFAADIPSYMQAYSLSCEYAAAFAATAAFGEGVPESAFIDTIGQSENPHWGYRGNIEGPWGGTDDYGVYAEALVPTLNNYGFSADVFYGGDVASLTSRLDAGAPVLTWLGYFGDTSWQQWDSSGSGYQLAPGMHVVTVYGYDANGVYLMNPGNGAHEFASWDDFLAKWAVLDGMALAVAPM